MIKEAVHLIKKLRLEKHPEGGYFKQTYKSDVMIDVAGYGGLRHAATAIYYMLASGQFSAFHRMKSDEIWHYYAGGSITIHVIDEGGKLARIKLGKGKDETPQAVIRAGTWFAASLVKGSYCLVGCTVSPGFDYRDWELAKRDELIKSYPQHRAIIEKHAR